MILSRDVIFQEKSSRCVQQMLKEPYNEENNAEEKLDVKEQEPANNAEDDSEENERRPKNRLIEEKNGVVLKFCTVFGCSVLNNILKVPAGGGTGVFKGAFSVFLKYLENYGFYWKTHNHNIKLHEISYKKSPTCFGSFNSLDDTGVFKN
ncbi:hypothetical protein AVEN_130841-1 [Araneus ventricosus]|uniref:Uncharacterized protein n=1 Tax=Araneus ventricosus TaxID=182803 RepID=A0A4Y2T235_ARAVE|nr:hypothetical protein AVEN_130841-1 [Araneus ventricosus]